MSPGPPRSLESSVLGESWVVASTPPSKEDHQPKSQRQTHRSDKKSKDDVSESMTTSTSSMSGPELIMPSIYEAPISEGSWIAPEVRSKMQDSQLKRRHKKLPSDPTKKKKQHKDLPITRKLQNDRNKPRVSRATPGLGQWLRYIRPIINLVLVAVISHLLILPELVHQYQTLCTIEIISTIYPASCIPPYPQPQFSPSHSSRYDSVVTTQTRLESLFNATLQEMAPISSSLKQSESMLRDVQTELRKAYPSTKHELDLEFHGCWQAARTATTKFDSLKADIQSAVDSLIATGGMTAKESGSAMNGARFSAQMVRREQYLDQMTSRMQSKADSLSNEIATLDDHLESIGSIVIREMKASSSSSSSPVSSSSLGNSKGLWEFIDSVIPRKLTSFLRAITEEEDSIPTAPSADSLISTRFEEAASHHRPVADLIQNLSKSLQSLQKKESGPSV